MTIVVRGQNRMYGWRLTMSKEKLGHFVYQPIVNGDTLDFEEACHGDTIYHVTPSELYEDQYVTYVLNKQRLSYVYESVDLKTGYRFVTHYFDCRKWPCVISQSDYNPGRPTSK